MLIYTAHPSKMAPTNLLEDVVRQSIHGLFGDRVAVSGAVVFISAVAMVAVPLLLLAIFNRPPTRAQSKVKVDGARDDQKTVLLCELCQVNVIDSSKIAKHAEGKKHAKALAQLQSADSKVAADSVFKWITEADFEKLTAAAGKSSGNQHAKRKSKHKSSDDDSDSDDEDSATPVVSGGKSSRAGNKEGLSLHGKGVSVVYAQPGDDRSSHDDAAGGGGWTKVKGSAGGAAPSAATKDIVSNLLYMEGGMNILQGLVVNDRFVAPSQETSLLQWVDETIREGQGGRLRGSTFTKASVLGQGAPAQLSFGCYYDWQSGEVISNKSVEPVPRILMDISRRLAQKGEVLGSATGSGATSSSPLANSVTIYDLAQGQYLPPHLLSSTSFSRPFYMLALAGDEDMPLGLRIAEIQNCPGEYSSGFAHRLKRRALVAFSGPVSTQVQHAVASVQSQRFVLIVFRKMSDVVRAEMQARGNVA